MAIKRNNTRVHIEKVLLLCFRTTYRSACYHPFIFSLVLFLLVLYRYFPSLFAFLVSSSPVIVCTTLLLGLLLSYGEPNLPEIEEESKRNQEGPYLAVGSFISHLHVKKDENSSIESHVEYRNYNHENELSKTIMRKEKTIADEDINQAAEQLEGDMILDAIVETISSTQYQVQKEGYAEDQVIQKELQYDRGLFVKELDDVAEVNENVIPFYITDKQETQAFELETVEPETDRNFNSSLGLSWQSIGDNHASDTDSDRAESLSPDASMTDIIPMLHELHPLLNSEHPQHVSASKSDAASEGSSQDHETDDSIDEQDEKDGEKKDGEVQKERDDGTEAAVKWTEDDQKNVMDLGSSELERDRRLESLIAKRRARKNLTFRMDRNLVDLDANDSFLTLDELSLFHVQVPARRNPFDNHYGSEESLDLPPIPGSAPSSLLHRRNPFDIFYDQQEQDSNLTGETWGHQDFVSAPQHDTLFRRNETFGLGRRKIQQERRHSRLKPYFAAEKINSDEGVSTFQRQFSDKSESKVSSIPESDAASMATDQDYSRDLKENEIQQDIELSSLAKHDADAGEFEIHTSEGESVDIEEEESGDLICHLENDKDTDHIHVIQESYKVVEHFGAVEDIKENICLNLLISDAQNLEMAEQKHDESNASLSVEDQKSFKIFQQSSNLEQTVDLREYNTPGSGYFTRIEQVYDHRVGESLYDSSPPSAGKSLSRWPALDETLLDAGYAHDIVDVDSSVKFDMEEISEIGTSPKPLEVQAASEIGGTRELVTVNTQELASVSIGPFTSLESSICADDNNSRSMEMDGTGKYFNVKIGKSDTVEEASHLIASMSQGSEAVDGVEDIYFSLLTAKSGELDPINVDASCGIEKEEMVEIKASPLSDVLFSPDDVLSSEFQKSSAFMEKYSLASHVIGIEKSQVSTLDSSSISDENQDDLEQNKYDPSYRNHDQIDHLTGSPLNETLKFLESDSAEHPSFFNKSRQEIRHIDDNDKILHKLECSTSDIYPVIPIQDGGSSGAQSIELIESTNSTSSEKFDIKDHFVGDLSRSRFAISKPVLAKNETGYLEMFDSSEEESDVVHHLVLETDEIDDSLPADVDGAVDFHIEELSSDHPRTELLFQEGSQSDPIASSSRSSFELDYKFSEGRSPRYSDMLVNELSRDNFGKSQEMDLEANQSGPLESEIWYTFDSKVNTEQTVYNPKMRVLEASLVLDASGSNQLLEEAMPSVISELPIVEARSIEDIYSAFKQINEESLPSVQELSQPSQLEKENLSSFGSKTNIEQTVYSSNMHVLEESLVQKVDSGFSQCLQEAIVPSVSESDIDMPAPPELVLESSVKDSTYSEVQAVETRHVEDISTDGESFDKPLHHDSGSQNSPGDALLDAKQIQSDLHVVEAKSIEDINEIFSQLSHITTRIADQMETEDKSLEAIRTGGVELHNSDLISLTWKEPFVAETSLSIEKSGAETVDNAASAASLSIEKQKKQRRSNSASSSSSRSSSSSSDSDITETKHHEN